ncbi:MAG: hypothetical protein ACOX1X_07705 [Dethiobacteria bacterium]|jgi:hypothetical protein
MVLPRRQRQREREKEKREKRAAEREFWGNVERKNLFGTVDLTPHNAGKINIKLK